MEIGRLLAITFVFVFCGALPLTVSAHATPISYTPEAGATELAVPLEVSITFTERIELEASNIAVYGPDGEEVGGEATVKGDEGRTYSVPILQAGEGVYTISWQVVSVDDGHFTKGANSFLVDATGKEFEGSSGGVEVTYVTRPSEAVFNFLGLLGESLILAALFFLSFILKPLYRKQGIDEKEWKVVRDSLMQIAAFGVALFLSGNILTLVGKTSNLALLQERSFLDILPLYVASTVGASLVCKIVAGSVFMCILLCFKEKIFRSVRVTLFEGILFVCILGILYLQSSVSHAAASHFYPEFSVWVTLAHLFAKELIIGGALLLCVFFGMYSRRSVQETYRKIALRYDVVASVLILLAGISGAYVIWLHLKGFEHFFDTTWGRRCVALLVLTGMLGLFRLWHQFFVHPFLGSASKKVNVYRITLPIEVLIGLCVLFLSGYISVTTPPFMVEKPAYQQSLSSDGVTLILEAHPYEEGSFKVSVKEEETNESLEATEVLVLATENTKGIGPNQLTVEKRAVGEYVFDQQDLSPPGTWNISVIAKRNTGYDVQGQFTITYPDDVETAHASDLTRSYGPFTTVMLFFAFALAVFASGLIAHAAYWLRKPDVATVRIVPFTGRSAALSVFTACVLLLCALALTDSIVTTDFERLCLESGHDWNQAYPTREFENVSHNSLLGCTVHSGHFHFVDEDEFRYFMEDL